MTTYALVCDTVSPPTMSVASNGVVSVECNGQASYRDITSLPNSSWFLPPITQAEAYDLGSSIGMVLIIAFGIRWIRRGM